MTIATDHAVHRVGSSHSTRRLRAALRTNAVFSLVCGIGLLAGGWWLAAPWGLGPAAVPPIIGVGVAGFGVLLSRIAVEPAAGVRRLASAVVAADLAWATGSTVLLFATERSAEGATAVATVAVVVLVLAVWQLAGIAAVRPNDPLANVEVVEASTVVAAKPHRVWPLLTDHDLFGRLAPNLSTVEVISEPGAPLRRRCTSSGGDSWEEICTLWDDGRRFAVEVDTSDYPYPLTTMRGLWQVDPHPDGSAITMRFAYQPDRTVRGGLFAIVFRPLFPRVLARIFHGWRQRLQP